MNAGLVLGGVAKGAIDTYTTLSKDQQEKTAADDTHAQQARDQEDWRYVQSQAALAGQAHAPGSAVGSTTGDSQGLGDYFRSINMDPSLATGMTAAQATSQFGNQAGGTAPAQPGVIPAMQG